MVSVKSKVFDSHPEVCKWINENRIDQSQILAITHIPAHYTVFYYD